MPTPCFWYAADARVAFDTYAEAFPDAAVTADNGLSLELTLGATTVAGLNGGPGYTPNETLSAFVELPTVHDIEHAYAKLNTAGARLLMELAPGPYSPAYAWLADEWGVNWQLTCTPDQPAAISPALFFPGALTGRAEPAMALYGELFSPSEVLLLDYHAEAMGGEEAGVMHAQQRLGEGKMIYGEFAGGHEAAFSEAGSLVVKCDTQAEIDRYWKALTAGGGKPGRCGWYTDRFGVSWQVIPRKLHDWMSNPRTAKRVGERMQEMGKPDLARLDPGEGRGLKDLRLG